MPWFRRGLGLTTYGSPILVEELKGCLWFACADHTCLGRISPTVMALFALHHLASYMREQAFGVLN